MADPLATSIELTTDHSLAVPAASKNVSTVSKSPTRLAMDRLVKDRTAIICTCIVLFFALVAIFAPLLAHLEGQTAGAYNTDLVDQYGYPLSGPTGSHWFGVEPRTGRDLFARWVSGARPSMFIGFAAAIVATVIGIVVGLLAGFAGGWTDRVLTWIVDFVLSLPYLLFAMALVYVVIQGFGGPTRLSAEEQSRIRFIALIFVLAFFGWGGLARIIRGQVLSLREREFIQAARAIGVPTPQILRKELLPNLVAPIVVSFTLAVPVFIVAEAGLSFLGVGLTEPTASWGVTIASAQNYYRADPLYLWLPVVGIVVLVLALALLGDVVRDAFDPSSRR